MKHLVKRIVLLVALCVMTLAAGYAQEPTKVGVKVNEIVEKYGETKGVECMTVTKGSGLGLVKTLMSAQLGKDFMKGVTSMTFISYKEASPETCQALHEEFEVFSSMLEEFKSSDGKGFANKDYVRCFAATSDEEFVISDFILAIEDNDTKMLIYMAGKIKVK